MNRYWVGGSGNWDATTTTNWSATSGGLGGASAPTSADDVFFDAGSDAGGIFTVTIGTGAVCRDITVSGLDQVMTLAGSATWSIYGSLTFPATNFTRTYTGQISFAAATTGKIITTNGVALGAGIRFEGIGGGWSLGSAFTGTSITCVNGAFTTNNFNITGSFINASGASAKSINLGSSTLVLSAGIAIDFNPATMIAVDAGTSIIQATGASATFAGGGFTYHNLSFTNIGAGTSTITGANAFNNLTFTSIAATGIRNISIGANQTVNGTLTLGTANTAIRRMFAFSDVIGTPRTITAAAIATLADVDFRDIVAAGASGTWTGTRLGNCGGNSGITFSAPKTVYWNLDAGGNFASNAWALTSNGTPDVNNFPLAQDTIIFDNDGLNSGVIVYLGWNWQLGTINFSTRTLPMGFDFVAPIVYGDITLSSTVTISGTTNIIFSGDSTQVITSSGKSFSQPFNVNKPAGISFSIADNFTTSGAFLLTQGTLDLNNFNLTAQRFDAGSVANARTVAFGTGGMYLTGNNVTVYSVGLGTNYTVTGSKNVYVTYSGGAGTRTFTCANAAGINETNAINAFITAGSDSIATGATSTGTFLSLNTTGFSGTISNGQKLIYNNLTVDASTIWQSGIYSTTFSPTGTATINTNGVTIDNPVTLSTGTLQLSGALTVGSTRTFTLTQGTLNLNGFDLTCGLFSSSNSNIRSIAFGTGSINLTGNNTTVFAMQTATNFTYTDIPTVNLTYSGGTGTRILTFGSSGGATESNVLDLNVTSGTDIISIGGANSWGSINFTGFNGTFTQGGTLNIWRDLTYSAGSTLTASAVSMYFRKSSGAQTVTSNGKTIDAPIEKLNDGTLQLLGNLTQGATRAFTFTAGGIDLNGNDLTVGTFSTTGATARNINHAAGGELHVLGATFTASGSNLTTSGAGSISMDSASAKTFAGGGFSYQTLNQGGAGDLSITGANTFADITNTVQPCQINFPASVNTTVSDLSVNGTAGNLVKLRSSISGTRANIVVV